MSQSGALVRSPLTRFLTSSAVAAALAFIFALGHPFPHSVYWIVAGVGWLVAFYRAWCDEYQSANKLKQELAGELAQERRDAEKRELIRVITELHAMEKRMLHWRNILRQPWGIKFEKLVPDDVPTILHWAEKIRPDLRIAFEDVSDKAQEAERLIKQFVERPPSDMALMRRSYNLVDEALPRLDNIIAEFESFEAKLPR